LSGIFHLFDETEYARTPPITRSGARPRGGGWCDI
jgi:hypothetical protein